MIDCTDLRRVTSELPQIILEECKRSSLVLKTSIQMLRWHMRACQLW